MRAEKQQLVLDLGALVGANGRGTSFLITYKGMKVADFAVLRSELAQSAAECHVVPNRLLARAAREVGCGEITKSVLGGDTALVTGGKDPVSVARTLRTFAKTHAQVTFKLGMIDGKVYAGDEMAGLADLPGLDGLRAQLVGLLQAPMRQLVGVLNAKSTSILYVLQAYMDKQKPQP